MDAIHTILLGSFGAFCQEVVHLYDLRATLHCARMRRVYRSWQYWVITVLMVLASGMGVWVMCGDRVVPEHVLFVMGAAFPMLFKKLTRVAVGGQVHLGGSAIWRDYLGFHSEESNEA